MRSNELTGSFAHGFRAQIRKYLSLGGHQGHSWTEIGYVLGQPGTRRLRTELANEGDGIAAAAHEQAAGPAEVVPLRFVAPVRVEDLDAMVLAVGHVHPTL